MPKKYKVTELIMNNEVKTDKLTIVDDKHMESIKTPDGRELTPEELFDFVLGDEITDLARSKRKEETYDIAIVLGSGNFRETRERAIKAFELYRLGVVKKIIFTGGIHIDRDEKRYMHPSTLEEYMSDKEIKQEWADLPEADWGAETFVPDAFDENYKKHSILLTDDFLRSIGVDPKDILTEPMSKSTKENAEFCKNAFDAEEIETGMKIRNALLISTCTHLSRATKQFQKVFGDSVTFKKCASTLDLEKYDSLKSILRAKDFDEDEFKKELKRIYCTVPELKKKLMEETANHRNAFIIGSIDDAGTIETIDSAKSNEDDFVI